MSDTITVNTKSGRSFEIQPENYRLNDACFPFGFNPHNVRPFIIGNEFGAICVVWATCEQDAFDSMVDANFEQFIVSPETIAEMSDEEREELTGLGNSSELCDLTYAWIEEVSIDYKTEHGFNTWINIAVLIERGCDSMEEEAFFNI